jgi:F-type H+-transporting ATPase subunit gamma
MASAREVKNRIKSVKNISQITRAMEAVSASRVRKAQARVMASRAFAEKAWEILLNVQSTATKGVPLHPLLAARDEVKEVIIVLITADRGLAGAYNTNITRVAQRFAERLGKPARYITIGRKGRDSLIRAGANVVAEFSDLPGEPRLSDIAPAARLAVSEFLSGTVDQVFIAYTDFVNTLTQRPVVLGWLPLIPYYTNDQVMSEMVKSVPSVSNTKSDYEYEPSAAAILDQIVPRFTELQLYQAVLESQASEHSARMVAMRNASDNATQLTADLTLVYNKARQSAITAEILDIVGGAEALQSSIDSLADKLIAGLASIPVEPVYAAPPPAKAASKTTRKAVQPAAASHATAVAEATKPDDLTVIEGIGPKMSGALIAAGIDTYEKLSQASEEQLRAAIETAGLRFAPSMSTWAEQAGYAARNDWDGLDTFQGELIGGRKPGT